IGAIAWTEQRWPSRRGIEAGTRPGDAVPAVLVAVGAAGAAGGLVLARPHQLLNYASTHTTFVAGALAIAALAALIVGVMAIGFRAPQTR
ncbi:MAG TPA: hypothetical protein VNT55_25080, partial [Baekduia sp.]|nr:hypothetical protein [Baekduia sp.]